MPLSNKNILLGITGGIAAYKAPDVVRKLKKQGAEVRVVLTTAATEFVAPLSLQVVSQNPVNQDVFDPQAKLSMSHIELAKWADLVVIAPATANVIAKLAHGLADDLLSTVCLATTAPIAVVPSMNKEMYFATVTQRNLTEVRNRPQFHIWGPDTGEQACGDVGSGRMLEPEAIVQRIHDFFVPKRDLDRIHFVITAGPTREALDPVRYISNHSSGQMGFELAKAAAELGAKVTLITGPVTLKTPIGVERIDVVSAKEMYDQVMKAVRNVDIFIGCAAVADYRAAEVAAQKMKKENKAQVTLVKNPDIVAEVAGLTTSRPFVVGFAAETEHLEKNALQKLATKHLDLICANDVSVPGQGFNSPQNAVILYGKNTKKSYPRMAKNQLAKHLIEAIRDHYEKKH